MIPTSGVMKSFTSAVTRAANAAPMTNATARSTRLPRSRNFLKPDTVFSLCRSLSVRTVVEPIGASERQRNIAREADFRLADDDGRQSRRHLRLGELPGLQRAGREHDERSVDADRVDLRSAAGRVPRRSGSRPP